MDQATFNTSFTARARHDVDPLQSNRARIRAPLGCHHGCATASHRVAYLHFHDEGRNVDGTM